MEDKFTRLKNFLIGRQYSDDITSKSFRLNIVDKPFYRVFIILFYAITATYVIIAYKKLDFLESWLLVAGVFILLVCPLYLLFSPQKVYRYTILNGTGWFLSPGFTVVNFSGNILWKNVRRVDRSIFGVSTGKSGFFIVAKFYTVTLESGKTIEIYRVFTPEFESRLHALIQKKKIPYTDRGLSH